MRLFAPTVVLALAVTVTATVAEARQIVVEKPETATVIRVEMPDWVVPGETVEIVIEISAEQSEAALRDYGGLLPPPGVMANVIGPGLISLAVPETVYVDYVGITTCAIAFGGESCEAFNWRQKDGPLDTGIVAIAKTAIGVGAEALNPAYGIWTDVAVTAAEILQQALPGYVGLVADRNDYDLVEIDWQDVLSPIAALALNAPERLGPETIRITIPLTFGDTPQDDLPLSLLAAYESITKPLNGIGVFTRRYNAESWTNVMAETSSPIDVVRANSDDVQVSPSTRVVLEAVGQPITLRLFMSSRLIEEVPDLGAYAARVTDMLRTFEQLSGGLVRFEWIDPAPFSAEEDKAIGYNLFSLDLGRAGEQGYFGLVGTNTVDLLEIIDVLSPEREAYLEYDLTRMVVRLASPTEPRVGVMDGLGLFGSVALDRGPAAVIERLGDNYAVGQLAPDITIIPEDIDVLVIIHPHNLAQSALYAVDQYVIRGGPVLVFLDVVAEHSTPSPTNQSVPQFPDSTLEPLLTSWGVTMVPGRVVGDINMALEVRAQADDQMVFSEYPPWLIVDQDNLSRDDVITAQLSLMRISSAGALQQLPYATTVATPLIQTTPESMLFEQATILRRLDPRTLVDMFEPSGEPRVVAARIVGPVETAFPEGAPPPPEPRENEVAPPEAPELITQSTGPISVIIVTDTDMLADDHNVNDNGVETTHNADFVINAIDDLLFRAATRELERSANVDDARAGELPFGDQIADRAGEPMFPTLADSLGDIHRLTIEAPRYTIDLSQQEGRWVAASNGAYPVKADLPDQILAALVAMTIVEPKTNDPNWYQHIDVAGPSATRQSISVGITAVATDGNITDVIVGRQSASMGYSPLGGTFVRLVGQDRAWLVEGTVSVVHFVQDWFDQLLHIPGPDVASITILSGEEVMLMAEKVDFATGDYELTYLSETVGPAGSAAIDSKLRGVTQGIVAVSFDDARSLDSVTFAENARTVRFVTAAGLQVDVILGEASGETWAAFKVAADPNGVAAEEAQLIQSRTEHWAFMLPSYRIDALSRDLAELFDPPLQVLSR